MNFEFLANWLLGLLIEPYVLLRLEERKKRSFNGLKRMDLVRELTIMVKILEVFNVYVKFINEREGKDFK